MSVTTRYHDTETLQTDPSYLLDLRTPCFLICFQSRLVFYLAWWHSFHLSLQVSWSHWISICETNKYSLYLTWVLFALPGTGRVLRLQGGLAFNLHVIVTCLHQDRGMPQQDKVLWKFRLLLLASSKGNYFSATHVELPVANTEAFCQTKATGPLLFTMPKMQSSQTRESKAKSWASHWRLDLVKLASCEKSSFMVLVLLIWTWAQSFSYKNSHWIELREAKTCALQKWKNMLWAGITGFGRNRTEYSTPL